MAISKSKVIILLCGLMCCIIPYGSIAQLCSGNLGDPIVNIKFGGGGTPAAPPRGIFPYNPGGGCAAPGFFSIGSLIFGCGSNTLFLMAGDHTRDSQGKFMVVNAAGTTGTIYRDTITGLCGSTSYQFSAFVSNELQKIACGGQSVLPELTFTAKTETGLVLGTYNTGGITLKNERTWEEFGVFFTTPAAFTKLILEITSAGAPGCGSVFSIDDITLRPCGPVVTANMIGFNSTVIELCEGGGIPLVLNGSYPTGFNDPVTIWQISRDTGKTWFDIQGATNAQYIIPQGINYGVIIYRLAIAERVNFAFAKCRIFSNTIWANLHPRPVHQPVSNLVGCLNKDLTLRVETLAKHYYWTGPNGFQADGVSGVILPNVQLSDAGLYTVLIESDYGCTTLDSFNMAVYPSTSIQVTPSYDVCEGQTIRFDASGGNTYLWEPGTGLSSITVPNPILTPKDSSLYKVVATNVYGCRDSAYVQVNLFRSPVANAGPDINIIKGDTAILKAYASGTAISFSWSPVQDMNNAQSIRPSVFPSLETHYKLRVVSAVGCPAAEDMVTVKVFNDLYIPNAFTPNDDGINDIFRVFPIEGYTLKNLSIYNRWGKRIFKTTDPSVGWNGYINQMVQPAGIYIYVLEWIDPGGRALFKKGTLQLIR